MFLGEPRASEAQEAAYAEEREADGYVSNHTRLWSWRPDLDKSFSALRTSLDDREIFEATVFIAFRLAFSTVNDALGAAPDAQLAAAVPEIVRAAVTYGRAPSPAL